MAMNGQTTRESTEEEDDHNNNGQDNSVNNNGNAAGNQSDGPHRIRTTCDIHSSMDELGYFPILLQDVLWDLGNTVKSLYVTDHYSNPAIGDYDLTRVHIHERLEISRGMRTRSVHNSTMTHITYTASISNAAKRALWSLCYTHRQELHTTKCRHLPRRTSGTEETMVPLGEDGQDRINILARVTAALNNDLEGVTAEFDRTYEKLLKAQPGSPSWKPKLPEENHRWKRMIPLAPPSHRPARDSVTAHLALSLIF
ncbi:uncharacterized protein C2845_PM03G32240 [Panicum miliaceum]|uniref:Uncharacterized protein n=1 Tax=Panicum miliaceum TaxID=4540 RepID=A0A3L6T8F2_PANMI|nr:uncharacterized protein C2845_PM03G32240 [Panicum miliaceum]